MAASKYPPQKTAEETGHLVTVVKDWSIAHGLTVRPPPILVNEEADSQHILATAAPVTLFPSPFPRVCFSQALSIQKAYNQLYASIAQDEEFLKGIVEEEMFIVCEIPTNPNFFPDTFRIIEVDEFIAKLWQIHLKVKKEGYVQNLALGLFRSDYMVHKDHGDDNSLLVIKQVEFNTIASSFGGLSFKTTRLHRYLAKAGYIGMGDESTVDSVDLPENNSTGSLALGLRTAFETYNRLGSKYKCCVLFLVQEGERNIFDQRHLEYELEMVDPTILVFRLPFANIMANTSISDTSDRELLYHPPHEPTSTYEVAVVYFRAGYGPQDYPNTTAWEGRLQIERSKAIKCPSILTQLAGAKKIQQVLATPSSDPNSSVLSRFLGSDHQSLVELEKTFTNIYPLDSSSAGLSAREIALNPELCKGYVLKPQREGGGNNIYRSAIPSFLRSLPESHWKSYILMEIITPPPVNNVILRNGKVEKGGVICELGIYGTCLWDHESKEVLYNQDAGYLLRTKGDQSEEGGVAAGFGAMDSCLLF